MLCAVRCADRRVCAPCPLIYAACCGAEPCAPTEHIANPRVFKTHQPISQMSHMASKFLCVIRDPEATLLSYFKFAISKGEKQIKDINEFVKMLRWMPGGTGERGTVFGAYIWQFYQEFWQCRELSNVCIKQYFSNLPRYPVSHCHSLSASRCHSQSPYLPGLVADLTLSYSISLHFLSCSFVHCTLY